MSMNNKLRDENLDFLFSGILKLETIEECYDFFEDLCTVSEIKAMSQRAVVAKMLRDHHVYSDIVARTGASTATISRVNRSLNYGCDGYDLIFGRMTEDEQRIIEAPQEAQPAKEDGGEAAEGGAEQ